MTDFSDIFQKILQEKEELEEMKEKNRQQNKISSANFDVSFFSNFQKVFNHVSENERNAEFIRSLKPLLSKELQVKAEESIKMLKIFSLIPALKEYGILN